jgi:diguanylate cyclase (GGDEF)-like protein
MTAPSASGGSEHKPAAAPSWRELAFTDPLTGLPNRRRLDEVIQGGWSRWTRDQTPVTVLVIDVDHFKSFNDASGHPAGDACLKTIAATLAATCDVPGGIVCRWGGEEFLMLLPDNDASHGADVARKMLEAVRGVALPHAAAPTGRVTVSIGVATAMPTGDLAPDELIARADRALYAAKRAGRDRIVAAPE